MAIEHGLIQADTEEKPYGCLALVIDARRGGIIFK